jgi:hypothetical protein
LESALEHTLIDNTKSALISYMDSHPESFEELVNLSLSDKQPYSWRASWLLWSCIIENDDRLDAHIHQIINLIPSFREEQQRELFIVLYKLKIPSELEGIVFDLCISTWEQTNKKPSVRFNAFKLLAKIAKSYPELSKEIKYYTQDKYLETLSTNAKKSILKLSKV